MSNVQLKNEIIKKLKINNISDIHIPQYIPKNSKKSSNLKKYIIGHTFKLSSGKGRQSKYKSKDEDMYDVYIHFLIIKGKLQPKKKDFAKKVKSAMKKYYNLIMKSTSSTKNNFFEPLFMNERFVKSLVKKYKKKIYF